MSIFPYIPDLAGDKVAGLTRFIADEFKKEHGVSVQVEATANPYDLNKLRSVYLADDEDSYDVMEVDTVFACGTGEKWPFATSRRSFHGNGRHFRLSCSLSELFSASKGTPLRCPNTPMRQLSDGASRCKLIT